MPDCYLDTSATLIRVQSTPGKGSGENATDPMVRLLFEVDPTYDVGALLLHIGQVFKLVLADQYTVVPEKVHDKHGNVQTALPIETNTTGTVARVFVADSKLQADLAEKLEQEARDRLASQTADGEAAKSTSFDLYGIDMEAMERQREENYRKAREARETQHAGA